MFISKRKFCSRRNWKIIYSLYQEHFVSVSNSCGIFVDKYAALERAMHDYRDCGYLYEHIRKVHSNVSSLLESVHKFLCPTNANFNATMRDWQTITSFAYRVGCANGEMSSVLSLCTYMEKNELSLRK